MPYSYFFSDGFEKQYKKLDSWHQELVKKKIQKITENPELGKPLHKPLQNYKSERVEKLRVIYTVRENTIEFCWIQHRKHAYD